MTLLFLQKKNLPYDIREGYMYKLGIFWLSIVILVISCGNNSNSKGGNYEEFKLTYSVENGGMTIQARVTFGANVISWLSSGDYIPPSASALYFVADPTIGKIASWKVNGVLQEERTNVFEMDFSNPKYSNFKGKDINVVAFSEDAEKFTVTYEVVGAGGTISATKRNSISSLPVSFTSSDLIYEGSELRFIAKPNSSKIADTWKINNKIQSYYNSNNEFRYFVKASDAQSKKINISLQFRDAQKITINYSVVGGGGTIKGKKSGTWTSFASGTQLYEGSSIFFEAKPDSGMIWDIWKLNSVIQSSAHSQFHYTVRVADTTNGIVNVTVQFRNAHKMTVNYNVSGSGGTITGKKKQNGTWVLFNSGEQLYEGTEMRFVTTAYSGKVVNTWTINNYTDSYFTGKDTIDYELHPPLYMNGVPQYIPLNITVNFKNI